ncbi:MAG: hypothetical protein IEMM0008_1617 [bacterium]|nr:MAG: hypothetical protein IEMM0008_1617 [bacterium]
MMHRLTFIIFSLFLVVISPSIAPAVDFNTSSYYSPSTPFFSELNHSSPANTIFRGNEKKSAFIDISIPYIFLIDLKINKLTVFWAPNRKWNYTPFKTLSGGFMLPISKNIEFYYCIFKTKNQFSSINYYFHQQVISHVGFTLPY